MDYDHSTVWSGQVMYLIHTTVWLVWLWFIIIQPSALVMDHTHSIIWSCHGS
jgi:hypothetical protein